MSMDARSLLGNLIQGDTTKRFGNMRNGVADIQSHSWFSTIDWVDILERRVSAPHPDFWRIQVWMIKLCVPNSVHDSKKLPCHHRLQTLNNMSKIAVRRLCYPDRTTSITLHEFNDFISKKSCVVSMLNVKFDDYWWLPLSAVIHVDAWGKSVKYTRNHEDLRVILAFENGALNPISTAVAYYATGY